MARRAGPANAEMGAVSPAPGRPVDLASYPRRRLFEGFRDHQLPVFSISTGRTVWEEGRERLPIAVQAHHALVDGVHVARMLDQLSHLCRHPQDWRGGAGQADSKGSDASEWRLDPLAPGITDQPCHRLRCP